MLLVGLANTTISTGYAQKSPLSLVTMTLSHRQPSKLDVQWYILPNLAWMYDTLYLKVVVVVQYRVYGHTNFLTRITSTTIELSYLGLWDCFFLGFQLGEDV